jgi:hypothetical protein
MFTGSAFREGDESEHSTFPDLGCELASSSMLLFCFS